MIKNINSSGRYITVSGGSSANPYISPGCAGIVRWNSNTHQLEVNDSNSWVPVSMNYATIELNPEAESLLDWARKKQTEEHAMSAMLEKYPALRKAKDNFDILLNLVKDDYK